MESVKWYEEFDRKIGQYLSEIPIEKDVSMAKYTSFHIGGMARRMAFPQNRDQLVSLMELARETGTKPVVLGRCTNVLVKDEGIDRLVIKTDHLKEIRLIAPDTIECDAGVSMMKLALFACDNGLTGLEFAHGIPGSVGGAVYMNAGAYGGEMKQVVNEVIALYSDGIKTVSNNDLDFSYRHSAFSGKDAVVLSARMKLYPGKPDEIRQRMDELMSKRKEKQPLEYPSAGSTFKRPEGNFAGALIEKSGLKGYQVGGARVSDKHAGFVINVGNATCSDVLKLIDDVQKKVYLDSGIRLEPEVLVI